MLKNLYKFLKRITVSFFILYGSNQLVPASAIIPINLITVFLIGFFNVPALIILIIIKITLY